VSRPGRGPPVLCVSGFPNQLEVVVVVVVVQIAVEAAVVVV
jgi:hypothetical protein